MSGRFDNGRRRRTVLKGVGAGGVALTAGCLGFGGGDSPDEITFGQPGAITGTWDFLQPAVSDVTDMAIEEIDEAGGPLDADVNLVRRDTAVDPQQARDVVRQLINNDDARAILGLYSSEINPLWDFLQEQEVPIVTPWPGSTLLDTRGGDKGTPDDLGDDEWVWRTVIGDTVHTLGAAFYLLEEGIEEVGILNGTAEGERSWADSFGTAYEENGGTVVEQVEVSEGQSSYQSELDRLFDADFDAWALALGLEDATTVIRDWASAGYGRQLLLEDGLRDDQLWEDVGEEVDGAWIAAGSGRGPNFDSFSGKIEEYSDESMHPWAISAYDATNVAALAIHAADSADHAEIERQIGPITREGGTQVATFEEGKAALDDGDEINYEGAATVCDFTEHGNVLGAVGVDVVTPDGFERRDDVSAEELAGLIDDY